MSYAGSVLLDPDLDRGYSPMSLGRLRRSYSMGAFPNSGYMNPYYPADDLYVGTRYSMYGGGGYPPMSSWGRRRYLYPDMRRRSLMSDYMYSRNSWNPYGGGGGGYGSYPYGGGGYGGGYYNPYGGYGGYGGYGMGMSGMGMGGMGMGMSGMGMGMGYGGGYSDYDYGYGYGGSPYYSGMAY